MTEGWGGTKRLAIASALILAGCSGTVVKDRVSHVSVPVAVKCASEKPAPVTSVRDRIDQAAWDALTLKQKAETMAAQGLRRLNYSDALTAATSAC